MLAKHCAVAFRFWQSTGRLPQLSPPLQQWDKFFWRKAFDHNPMFEIFCDKLACKDWACQRCPDLPVPATLWQGDTVRDIPEELFRQPAFIKANNGSGYNVRIDGQTDDRRSIEARFSRWLSRPYGQGNAEWGYRNVPRTVFLEEIIAAPDGTSPVMIEVYAAGGKPAAVLCVTGWKDEPRQASFFDLKGDRVSAQPDDIPCLHDDWQPPSGFGKAIGFSKLLVEGTDQVRCDFMCVGDNVWFSEMTPYTLSGLETFGSQDQEDYVYGAWDLRQSWFLQIRHKGWKQIYAEALQRML
ncbi:MAG: ATP-grasp fold amidoligase family protein [Anderseniella sp.]